MRYGKKVRLPLFAFTVAKWFSINKDDIKLKYEIIDMQINLCKNMIEEFNLELKPEWKKFIYGDFYLKQAFKQINYRTLPSNEYQSIYINGN